jgi:hypothetical protein
VEDMTSLLKIFRRAASPSTSTLHSLLTAHGVDIYKAQVEGSRSLSSPLLAAWLRQLEDEGLALSSEKCFHLTWGNVYALMSHVGHASELEMLELPQMKQVRPALHSSGSLDDATFSISISSWQIGEETVASAELVGAVLSAEDDTLLLPPAVWRLVEEVLAFAQRSEKERNGQAHRLAWGRIRGLAIEAGAKLDGFLHKTVVLTPERLNIGLRKNALDGDTVIEVQPTFTGAPDGWLSKFDFHSSVQQRYEFATSDGIVQVVISPKVRTVLEEIKRLPNRRVAGARAQAFVLNPYAALGEDAGTVIDEEQFESARASAELDYERFLPLFERDGLGYPTRVGLLVESASSQGPTSSETVWLNDKELAKFCSCLAGRPRAQTPVAWMAGVRLRTARRDWSPPCRTGIRVGSSERAAIGHHACPGA